MNTVDVSPFRRLTGSFLIALAIAGSVQSQSKIDGETLVAKHLESIGTAEARKARKSTTIVGTTSAVFKGRGEGRAEGIVVLASQAEKNMIGMKFNNADYQFERMGFDGNDFSVGFVRPGSYSVLGQFLRVNEKTFKSGIMGGALSSSWELLDYSADAGKLQARGDAKIDGVEALKFEYRPKKGSDLDVTFFFDAATYRHLRTEYRRVISSRQGLTVDTSSRQNETRYKMVEDFTDFRSESGLTLPHKYTIHLEIIAGNGTTSYTWTMDLQQFRFDQNIEAKEFKMTN